jgi:drug/metabolite transporter (DMT)-like permease
MYGYVFLVLAGIFIGTIGIFVKLAEGAAHPLVIAFYRLFFACLLLLVLSPLLDKTTFQMKKRNIRSLIFLGFLFAFNLSMTIVAYSFSSVQNIALILSMTPIFVFLFAKLLLHERITQTKIISLAIALLGLIILNPLRPEGLWGNLLAVIIVISGGLMMTILRKNNMNDSIGNVFWFLLFGSVFLLPFPFIFGFGTITLPLLALGLVSTGAAYLFYSFGFEFVEAQIGSLVTNIVHPLVAVVLAVFVLGELLDIQAIIGGLLLIIAGIYLRSHIHHKKIHSH